MAGTPKKKPPARRQAGTPEPRSPKPKKVKTLTEILRGKRITAIGIRYDARDFKIGAKVPRSYDWIDNARTPKRLPGTSSIFLGQGIDDEGVIDTPDDWVHITDPRIMRAAKANDYRFGHAYIIAGEDRGAGEDSHEVLIGDAVVIARLW